MVIDDIISCEVNDSVKVFEYIAYNKIYYMIRLLVYNMYIIGLSIVCIL